MIPIAAWAADFALFVLPAFFAAIFFPLLSREGHSFSKFHSPRKMDPSCGPGPLPPIQKAAPPRPHCPKLAQAIAIPAIRSNGSSNARRVFVVAARSIQNVSEISRPFPTIPQYPCSPKPPCAPREGASRPAASPATASPAVAAPACPRLRDRLCSIQKCLQFPSARLSYFECHRQDPAQARPTRNPPAAQYQSHPGQLQPSRLAHASSLPRPGAAPLPLSSAPGRREIPVWPSSE